MNDKERKQIIREVLHEIDLNFHISSNKLTWKKEYREIRLGYNKYLELKKRLLEE